MTASHDSPATPVPQPPARSQEHTSLAESQVEKLFAELLAKVREARPREDLSPLEKAYRFASDHHKLQLRDSGEPYMVHPLMVSHFLADMRMDLVSMETGLLHDVVEDTSVTIEDVRKNFGEEVARCVDGVTKLSKLDFFEAEERQAESFRKMLLAMVNDIRVIIVKLADRLHNMRTLEFVEEPDRRERIARETVEIYAPIAHRLGMGKIRGELEDLAFRHIDPPAWEEISRIIESGRQENEQFLERIRHLIEAEVRREGIHARVETRLKRAYSVYQKMKRQKITIEQVYDLMAIRIVTDSVKNCYAALGVIHNEWRPVPGRIKDFIAIPRPNLYQSLHTSVVGPEGRHFEVQIRTEEMHRIAEEGIAAHWKYKEGKKGPAADDQRIAWLRHLVEWQREMPDPGEFMSTLKVDLYPEEVYTFTPKGRVIILPRDATPIDFAYAIHSDVGNTCVGNFIRHAERILWPLACSSAGLNGAQFNLPHYLRKVFCEKIPVQFQVLADNLRSRNDADFSPRIMAIECRRIIQRHSDQRRYSALCSGARKDHAMTARSRGRLVRRRV